MDLSRRTVLIGALLGFISCVIASFAIGNSQQFESGAVRSLLLATGVAFFLVSPIAIAFHTAKSSPSQRPFLLGFLSGGLGGAIYAILVATLIFNDDLVMILGGGALVLALSAMGALAGLLLVNRNGP